MAVKSKSASALKSNAVGAADREFVITRILDAPRALVFRAWTETKLMAAWWGPQTFTNPVCELDPRPGGKWFIQMRGPDGIDHPCQGSYREIVPPERLVFTVDHSALPEEWHDKTDPGRDRSLGKPALEGVATVTFDEHRGKTKLTLRVRYESAAIRDSLLKMGMNEGWAQSLDKLAAEVAVKKEPLVIERTLNAPVEVVWNALVSKEVMKRWGFEIDEFKPEVGFEFQFSSEKQGVTYLHHCKITEVIPEKRLAYSWRYEGVEGNSLVAFDLAAAGDKTLVTITHTGLETLPKLPSFAPLNFAKGWSHILGISLREFVEKGEVKSG